MKKLQIKETLTGIEIEERFSNIEEIRTLVERYNQTLP